jgi:Immunity protein Imm5
VTIDVAAALATLDERPDGHLPRPERRRLGAAWGFDADGRRRRVALERRVAEHVLGRFEAERPGDDRPRAMLDLADAVLRGAVDREDAIVAAAGAFNDLEDLREEDVSDAAIYAALSATRVVATAGWDEEPVALDEDPRDDADQWDAAFWASLVDAPSLPWMGASEDVEPRRAFWRWYLSEAVPATDRDG